MDKPLTVKELVKMLQELPQDLEIVIEPDVDSGWYGYLIITDPPAVVNIDGEDNVCLNYRGYL